MTPNQYRSGGRAGRDPLAITYATVASPLGLLTMGATDRGLCFVEFGETAEALVARLRKEYPDAQLEAMKSPPSLEFQQWMDALNRYLNEKQPSLDLPVDVRATAFQMRGIICDRFRRVKRAPIERWRLRLDNRRQRERWRPRAAQIPRLWRFRATG
jgi:hypothetical protein